MKAENKLEIYSLLNKYNMPIFTQEYEQVKRISTGSLVFDWCLGGGLPRGRSMEIGGLYSYGKTTLALIVSATITKNGGRVAFIDAETTLDQNWATSLGVQVENFALFTRGRNQLSTAEASLQFILDVLSKNDEFGFDLIVLDSIAALAPKSQLEGDMEDKQFAMRARLLAQFFDNLPSVLADSGVCLLMLNQGRIDIGSMSKDKTTFPGGMSRKHAHSIMIKMLQPESLSFVGSTRESLAHKFRGYTTKNKTASSGREFELTVRYDPFVHVDKISDLVKAGTICNVFKNRDGENRSGSQGWFFRGESLGRGQDNVEEFLQDHPDMCFDIEYDIKQAIEESKATVEPRRIDPEVESND